jgi:hypothetical protein
VYEAKLVMSETKKERGKRSKDKMRGNDISTMDMTGMQKGRARTVINLA